MASSNSRKNMQNEWVGMLYQDGYLNVLKLHAFECELKRRSNIRSVCWKLFLEVLPEDHSLWVESSQKSRGEYERLKKKYIIDPHDAQASVDLAKNNPLSQEEASPWHQFFRDGELKRTIETDVIRTFPEEVYFKQAHVRESMINVLFCYGKEHPDTSYRQGMHELLAPLMFVLQSGQLDENELQTLPLELGVVMDPQYMEHDAFSMFSVLMETMQGWYLQGSQNDPKLQATRKFDMKHRRPFDDDRHSGSLPNVSYKLRKIHSVLLKNFDPEVCQRLLELDVAPEVYGIRWIRLLFSREFPFLSTLDLWDAIFAEGNTLEIVEYIYVAMLRNIRGHLLYQGHGYTECMSLLMNYPGQMDVQHLVQMARNMRYPKLVPPPPDMVDGPTVKQPENQQTSREERKTKEPIVKKLQEVQKKVKTADWSVVAGILSQERGKKSHSSPRTVSRTRSHSSKSSDKVANTKAHPETVVPVALAIDQANKIEAVAEAVGEELAVNPHRLRARPHSGSNVEHLEQKLDDLETLRKYCGSKMDTQLEILQQDVYAMELDVEEYGNVFTALAELKQVRDLLLGQLTFSGAVMDLSAPPTPDRPTHTQTHSGEGETQEVGHVTGRNEVQENTGSASEGGTASDDDIVSSPTHSHPALSTQPEAPPTLDVAPPTPSAEADPLPPPSLPQAPEECPPSAPSSELEVVEGELQDADHELLSEYTVLTLTPAAMGKGEERSCDSHVTGEMEAQ